MIRRTRGRTTNITKTIRVYDRISVLSKSHGQLLRLSAILHVLNQAIDRWECRTTDRAEEAWTYKTIPKSIAIT